MRLRLHHWLLAALAVGTLASVPLHGQRTENGAFAGTILDEDGRPLAGATVVFRGIDFELRREIQTDKEGRFHYGGFLPGRYYILLLRERRLVWSLPVTLEPFQGVLQLDVDLKKLREAAEQTQRLDPELERLREIERQRLDREGRLQTHLNRGVRHLSSGHADQAIEEFKAALALEPKRGATHALLGAAFAAAGWLPEAMESCRRALELEPAEAAHHNSFGALLVRDGKLDGALPHFEKAAQLDPERAASYRFNSGAALLNAGRTAEAISALSQAVRSDPKMARAHYFLGLALFRTSPRRPAGQGAERIEPKPGTLEAFQRYLQLAPDGEYAELARNYLRQLGVAPPEMLLPEVPPPGEFE